MLRRNFRPCYSSASFITCSNPVSSVAWRSLTTAHTGRSTMSTNLNPMRCVPSLFSPSICYYSTAGNKGSSDSANSNSKGDGNAPDQDIPNGQSSTPPPTNWLLREYYGFKHDLSSFPDIYNGVNMLQFVLFTIFCLSSTGSQSESEWWVRFCGIDGVDFTPWAWLLHPLLTTNFLSMAFAMIMVHNLGHTLATSVNNQFLYRYLTTVVLISGALIYLFNAFALPLVSTSSSAPYENREAQYGPWDLIVAMFFISHTTSGLTPFALFNSFNGWVKYATWVGGVVILYYDWQPCAFGLLTAWTLHRTGLMKIPITASAAGR